jgi:predicted nucleic acid-binding Zn ribbon protein
MRRKNTQKLNEVIEKYLEALDVNGKLKEVRLIRSWEEVVGSLIARKTERIFIREGVLFVYMNSSIARSELSMVRESLVEKLNQKAGGQVIRDIVLK